MVGSSSACGDRDRPWMPQVERASFNHNWCDFLFPSDDVRLCCYYLERKKIMTSASNDSPMLNRVDVSLLEMGFEFP